MTTERDRPVYCPQCGSIAQAGDRFCGVCGARIPPDAQDAVPTQEVPTQVPVPPSVPTRGSNRTLAAVAGLAVLLILALGIGAAFALGLLGGARVPSAVAPEPASVPAVGDNPTATPLATAPEGTMGSEAAVAEAEVERVVRDYYEAVDREDWAYTYENLDTETRAMVTEEEWRLKNQWFADNEGLELASMEVEAVMDLGGQGAEVTVHRTFEDGTSIRRDTYFVYEGGEWKHHFTDEEKDIFMPGASYEEFVAAQQ